MSQTNEQKGFSIFTLIAVAIFAYHFGKSVEEPKIKAQDIEIRQLREQRNAYSDSLRCERNKYKVVNGKDN